MTSLQTKKQDVTTKSKHVPFRKESLLISRYRFDMKAEALYYDLTASPLRGYECFKPASIKAAQKSGPR
jgi:hypothetical protein